jgi:hypothetical protein
VDTPSPSVDPGSETSSPSRGVDIGVPQEVGSATITLEEVDQIAAGPGQNIIELWYRVENNDNRTASFFCGGLQDVVIDSLGREFEGDSLIESYTVNCEDLNPGLSAYPYVLRFTVSARSRYLCRNQMH